MEVFDFNCKYCGGKIEVFDSKKSIGKCKYCGSKQTLPKLFDEKRANLFSRANHLRRNNEFDKAEALYELILNEDPADPEAYWSLVLCRFGVEYVEDGKSTKRIPTVNRTQMTSIFADENYKSAIEFANDEQKELYESEAELLNNIQKNILDISQNEEPFDVFICYKESDEKGSRTQDSVTAHELYRELTRDGYKVFYARETLHDKIGSAYEPYIFSALNSAKVMVVLGTSQDYFEAVWVRNEWSRFLNQIKSGERKTLIPVYKDMDAYDLPKEFANLQALNMDRVGFMQELVSGIEKILSDHRVTKQTGNTAPEEPVKKRRSRQALSEEEQEREAALKKKLVRETEAYASKGFLKVAPYIAFVMSLLFVAHTVLSWFIRENVVFDLWRTLFSRVFGAGDTAYIFLSIALCVLFIVIPILISGSCFKLRSKVAYVIDNKYKYREEGAKRKRIKELQKKHMIVSCVSSLLLLCLLILGIVFSVV